MMWVKAREFFELNDTLQRFIHGRLQTNIITQKEHALISEFQAGNLTEDELAAEPGFKGAWVRGKPFFSAAEYYAGHREEVYAEVMSYLKDCLYLKDGTTLGRIENLQVMMTPPVTGVQPPKTICLYKTTRLQSLTQIRKSQPITWVAKTEDGDSLEIRWQLDGLRVIKKADPLDIWIFAGTVEADCADSLSTEGMLKSANLIYDPNLAYEGIEDEI